MTVVNGHANGAATSPPLTGRVHLQYNNDEIRKLVAELETPFDPRVVEWRVCNKSDFGGNLRGQLVAYADSRAYQDRLNAVFTPAGWTRRYKRQFSGEVVRDWDGKTVSKVFVTCELTIHGLGTNSSTGEAWADDDNAGTIAESQSFKRSAACFGLGRYLYDIEKVWVDLDERKRPTSTPTLPKWATAEGWTKGLRPEPSAHADSQAPRERNRGDNRRRNHTKRENTKQDSRKKEPPSETVAKIENLHPSLGSPLYRGILKRVAKVWNPSDIQNADLERQVLAEMEQAEQLRRRFESVLQQVGEEPFQLALRSIGRRSFHQIDSVELLQKLIDEMERHAPEPF